MITVITSRWSGRNDAVAAEMEQRYPIVVGVRQELPEIGIDKSRPRRHACILVSILLD
jgi:hypothetical protein